MQLFAWLEANGLSGSDVDLSPGAGVAADAGFASADAEDAKSCLRPSKTVSTAASALVRGRPVRSTTL
jgi:hypothetical protein